MPEQLPKDVIPLLERQIADLGMQNERQERQLEHLTRQTEHLQAIRAHFYPEAELNREKRWRRFVTVTVLKSVAALVVLGGMWGFLGWFIDHLAVQRMASRYTAVAKQIFREQNNAEVALGLLDKAIEINGNDSEARFQRAYISGLGSVRSLLNLDRPLNKAELDQAHRALAEALFLKSLSPGRAEPYILESQILAALKDYPQARAAIGQALALEPANEFALVRLASLLVETQDLAGASQAVQRALAARPDSKWAHLWAGIVFDLAGGKPAAAQAEYRLALQADDKFDLAWYNLGWTYLNASPKDYRQALAAFEHALAINPDYKEADYAIAMLYGYQNRYDIGKTYLDKAIAVDPNYLTAYKMRGVMLGEMGRYEDSLPDFSRAIELAPQNADLYRRRAKALEKLGRLDAAVADLRFSLERDPRDARTWLYLGGVYQHAGDLPKALEHLRKAIELKPDYDDAYARKAEILASQHAFGPAIAAISRAIAVAGNNPERYFLQRARLYEQAGDTRRALADYCAARTRDANLADAWLGEARVLMVLKQPAAARQAVNRCLDLRPQDAAAQQLSRRLGPGPANAKP